MDLGLSGLASGFDWRSLVDQLVEVERAPQTQLRNEQLNLEQRNNAYSNVKSALASLQTRIQTLNEASLYESRAATVSDSSVASASAASGAVQGTFNFSIQTLATTARLDGGADIGTSLFSQNITASSPDPDTTPTLASANFAQAVTAGTFTINGKTVAVETTDTLKQVFGKIKDASGVDASYDSTTDRITLSSASPIILGSPADTSNFLQAARLNFNNSGSVTSSSALGAVRQSAALDSAGFSTALSDGGAGQGEFKINGVSISFSATADSLQDVMARINNSNAGVIATYDSVNDRLQLTNKATGDSGIALEDVTGNFLESTGLTNGALERGQNLTYTINNGGVLSSASNTITAASSGLEGLSVTALKQGSVAVQVTTDAEKIESAIAGFVTEYNRSQSMLDSYTASSTDADGVVTAGILANDSEASMLARDLRGLVNGQISGLATSVVRFDQLGYSSNSTDDTVALSDSEALREAITTNLTAVKEFFANETHGWAKTFDAFLEKTAGDEGTLAKHQTTLTLQTKSMDTQIADLERIVQSNRERMIDSFVQMEKAQAQLTQQMQFLQQRLGISSS